MAVDRSHIEKGNPIAYQDSWRVGYPKATWTRRVEKVCDPVRKSWQKSVPFATNWQRCRVDVVQALCFVDVSVKATKSAIKFVSLNSKAVHSPVHIIMFRPDIFGRCRLVAYVFCITSGMTERQQQCPISVGSLYSYIHLYGDLQHAYDVNSISSYSIRLQRYLVGTLKPDVLFKSEHLSLMSFIGFLNGINKWFRLLSSQ